MTNQIRHTKDLSVPILRRYGVTRAALFGSFARGEAKAASDIDFLVEFEPGRTLFDMGGLKSDLEDLFRRDIDLVEYSTIHPFVKDKVLREQISII